MNADFLVNPAARWLGRYNCHSPGRVGIDGRCAKELMMLTGKKLPVRFEDNQCANGDVTKIDQLSLPRRDVSLDQLSLSYGHPTKLLKLSL